MGSQSARGVPIGDQNPNLSRHSLLGCPRARAVAPLPTDIALMPVGWIPGFGVPQRFKPDVQGSAEISPLALFPHLCCCATGRRCECCNGFAREMDDQSWSIKCSRTLIKSKERNLIALSIRKYLNSLKLCLDTILSLVGSGHFCYFRWAFLLLSPTTDVKIDIRVAKSEWLRAVPDRSVVLSSPLMTHSARSDCLPATSHRRPCQRTSHWRAPRRISSGFGAPGPAVRAASGVIPPDPASHPRLSVYIIRLGEACRAKPSGSGVGDVPHPGAAPFPLSSVAPPDALRLPWWMLLPESQPQSLKINAVAALRL